MKLEPLISLLRKAEAGSRSLDSEIAQALGLEKPAPAKGGATEASTPNLSLVRDTSDAGKLPAYTTNIEAAYQLAQQISPNNVGGYSWRDGKANAQIGDNGEACWAATPALALCIAALQNLPEKS